MFCCLNNFESIKPISKISHREEFYFAVKDSAIRFVPLFTSGSHTCPWFNHPKYFCWRFFFAKIFSSKQENVFWYPLRALVHCHIFTFYSMLGQFTSVNILFGKILSLKVKWGMQKKFVAVPTPHCFIQYGGFEHFNIIDSTLYCT